jgi:hypothetical protein
MSHQLHTMNECDLSSPLKVPKCEIFDRSDFHDFSDFYTIKSLWEGNFEDTKNILEVFRGSFGAAKFPMCMLSLILRSTVPSKHAEHTHQ